MKSIIVILLLILFATAGENDSLMTVHDIISVGDREVEYQYNGPKDDFQRGTPQGALRGLSRAFNGSDFETAVHFMDFRNLPDTIPDRCVPRIKLIFLGGMRKRSNPLRVHLPILLRDQCSILNRMNKNNAVGILVFNRALS